MRAAARTHIHTPHNHNHNRTQPHTTARAHRAACTQSRECTGRSPRRRRGRSRSSTWRTATRSQRFAYVEWGAHTGYAYAYRAHAPPQRAGHGLRRAGGTVRATGAHAAPVRRRPHRVRDRGAQRAVVPRVAGAGGACVRGRPAARARKMRKRGTPLRHPPPAPPRTRESLRSTVHAGRAGVAVCPCSQARAVTEAPQRARKLRRRRARAGRYQYALRTRPHGGAAPATAWP